MPALTGGSHTLIKICGITREEDAIAAVEEGCDLIGFIFAQDSRRFVLPQEAARIAEKVKARSSSLLLVGVFRNAETEFVKSVARQVGTDLVQLHGDETEHDVRSLGLRTIKAVSVHDSIPSEQYASAEWLMYDAPEAGGGDPFDWGILRGESIRRPFFLAGGLRPENVVEALETAAPDGVDVSSGVESAPGIKSRKKIQDFVSRVRSW